MESITLGDGKPEYAVMGAVHGDEPCGKKAIERFLDSGIEVREPVKFVIANERALEEDVRYLEADLNRSFPGDPESEKYEERLAAEIMDEIEGLKLLDIHTTHSYPEAFATFKHRVPEVFSMVRSTGVSNVIYFPGESGSSTSHIERSVLVEAGHQKTEDAVDNAYQVLLNFLAAENVIEGEYTRSDPEVFKYSETVEGEGYEFLAENFRRVEAGETFARRNGDELQADEAFYPVLMSTNGYRDMLGFKARKLGRISDLEQV
ncbi:MAG: succinylglutamate desuccinylase/aspartoacylase family protein [Candidatus Nanohaloarchaea archaeon]